MATNAYERQSIKYVMVDLGIANIGTGNGYTAVVPRGAQIVDVGLNTVTAFNNTGTGVVTATIGDGTNTYVNAVDVKTAGVETAALSSAFLANGGTVTFSLTETVVGGTASTAGRAIGYVGYIQLGNGCSIQE